MIIYKAKNIINNKVYIGASKYSNLKIRQHGHLYDAFKRKKKKYTYFQRALRKHGEQNFIWEIIDTANNYKELMEKEKFWIKHHNSFGKGGYNACEGGGNTKGYRLPKSSRIIIGKKASLRQKGENNPFYGKTHSDEQKAKWSKERKGRKLECEWLENIRKARKKLCKPVINLDTGEIFNSIGDAHNSVGTVKGISDVCKGKGEKHAGYKWAFYENI